MKNLLPIAAAVLACTMPATLRAADGHQAIAQAEQAGSTHKLHGVVNSVNAPASRVNITHDPVESLKWPKMKMNFKAQDAALLEGLKAGTVVDFEIRKVGDEYLITRIEPLR